MEPKYELYREKYIVTEWRDDSVYKTESQGYGWFDMAEVDHPPRGVIYASPATDHDGPLVAIRRKRV